jgi:hypothetical protein
MAERASGKVEYDDTGFHVTQVQYTLRSFGYTIAVDGIFGPQTLKVVKHFQKVNGLEVDGIVGPKTLKAMGLILGNSKPIAPASHLPDIDPVPPVRTPNTGTPGASGADQWHDLAMSVGFTEAHWPVLRCIINRESRGQANAKNPHSSATGLTQILARYYPNENLYDPTTNLRIALQLYNSRGWQPWTLPGHQCY